MHLIRIPAEHWGKVWRALVAAGPVARASDEPVYVISDRQLKVLHRQKLPFEHIERTNGRMPGKSHG